MHMPSLRTLSTRLCQTVAIYIPCMAFVCSISQSVSSTPVFVQCLQRCCQHFLLELQNHSYIAPSFGAAWCVCCLAGKYVV